MKTKTINKIKVKNTEFSMGEKLFDMDIETAIKYKKLCIIDLKSCNDCNDRRTANIIKRVISNINFYIDGLA